jgi:DNA-binding NarL/FixJ family response regulator
MTECLRQESLPYPSYRQKCTFRPIADQLTLSIKTVQTHQANVMEKLDLLDITHLVRFAVQHGLIAPEP